MRLIDADALEFYDEIYDEETCGYIQYVIMEQIEKSPTIDPVKHGHWYRDGQDEWYKCSVCGEYGHDECCSYGWKTIMSAYCPHCGAKMDRVVSE